jgi:ABC-type dipeptide/oligopeptide/nickel transport system permease subunit
METTFEMKPNKQSRLNKQKSSLWMEFFQRMTKSVSSKLGVILLAAAILACLIGPFLSPYGINQVDLVNMFAKPSATHWLGCDAMGRDMLTRLLYGGRYSLSLGICSSVFGAIIGIIIGSVAGYIGNKTEAVIMRLMDVWSALPAMLLCILISNVMGSSFISTVIALSVGTVPGIVRMIRGQILTERSKEYIEAAQSFNCPSMRIMFRHLLPNVIQPIIVVSTMGIGMMMIMAASLSYIGLGIQPPNPEWGAMLVDGKTQIRTYPHMLLVPGIAIAITVFAINLMGDGIRDALDPKLRD